MSSVIEVLQNACFQNQPKNISDPHPTPHVYCVLVQEEKEHVQKSCCVVCWDKWAGSSGPGLGRVVMLTLTCDTQHLITLSPLRNFLLQLPLYASLTLKILKGNCLGSSQFITCSLKAPGVGLIQLQLLCIFGDWASGWKRSLCLSDLKE